METVCQLIEALINPDTTMVLKNYCEHSLNSTFMIAIASYARVSCSGMSQIVWLLLQSSTVALPPCYLMILSLPGKHGSCDSSELLAKSVSVS